MQTISTSVKGSADLTFRTSLVAQLTAWIEISPLELKLSIETQVANGEKVDFDKENLCSICFCELYDNLKDMGYPALIES